MEKRTFEVSELRVDRGKKRSAIVGHAAVFNQIGDGGWFREKIAPGAFAESINRDDIRALWNHDPNYVLGRNRSGTLKLREDEQGLLVEIDPPDTQSARDLLTVIERGDVSQMSFGFIVEKQKWEEEENQKDLRTLERVKLFDVSPVTFPFYEQTDVSIRASYEAWQKSLPVKPLTYNRVAIMRRRLELNQK